MTTGGEQDKRGFGPRPVGALLPALIRPSFRRRSAAGAKILTDWQDIVGPVLAAVTTPRKLAAGTLSVACSGPVALELQHLTNQVTARINQHLGSAAVQRIRVVQSTAPAAALSPPRRPPALAPAQRAVASLPAGPLRDALERLGRHVLSRPG